MVLLSTDNARVCQGPVSGLDFHTATNLTLRNVFSKLCKACQLKTMASIPPSAFSAGRIRQTQRDRGLSKPGKGGQPTKTLETSFMELSPQKYISKMMNSIWGQYNRYSPHNVKKINDAGALGDVAVQQTAAASVTKTEGKVTLPPPTKFENFFTAFSQSH